MRGAKSFALAAVALAAGTLVLMRAPSLLLSPGAAEALEPRVIKLATIAPEGTLWAQECRAAGGEIETLTGGALRVKFYNGGVAGDELEVLGRINKGQLDGTISAGILCEKVSPTLRAIRIPGMFESYEEAVQMAARLRPVAEAEVQANGLVLLGVGAEGTDVIFSKTPVRSLDDLRKLRIWKWEGDEVGIAVARAMGITTVPTPLMEASRAYEAGKLDGYFAIPTAALAFQWSAHTRYVSSLPVGHLNGCALMSARSFDKLPIDQQQAVRAAIAKLVGRVEQVSRREEAQLLGGLFARQGLTPVAPSPAFKAEFMAATKEARAHLDERVLPKAVIDRLVKTLADYRAEGGVAHHK
jgi:TRAP-type C4-dicarboxylate transport system substrate-binding protein